jgi:OOP family OmpA-OmpF porin
MKKLLFSLIALGFIFSAQAQTSNGGQKKTSIAIRLSALDFGTASQVQNGSIGSVLNAKKWGQLPNTDKAVGLGFIKTYSDQIDIYTNLDLSITKMPGIEITAFKGYTDYLYTSVESGFNFKMFKGNQVLNPFLTGGLGVRSFNFSKFSAYAPVGFGLQINVCKNSKLNLSTTYATKMSNSFVPSYNYGVSYSFLLN